MRRFNQSRSFCGRVLTGIGFVRIAIACIIIACLVGASYFFFRLYDFLKYYNEAEALVPIIWPMTDDIERFVEETGRRPISLEELAEESNRTFDGLEEYPHIFYEEGPIIFCLSVNERYGFVIDDAFRPLWQGYRGDPKDIKCRLIDGP